VAEFYGQTTSNDAANATDRPLQERVWRWFTKHADVWVGRNRDGNSLTLAEAEHRDGSQADGTLPPEPEGSGQTNSSKNDLRIYTTQDRVWQAIAGHSLDYKRVPRLEFQLLALIAAAGPDGILQPDLRSLSGQDKRSVPKRTDSLAVKGYIQKKPVYAKTTLANHGGTKTSLCIHTRFAKEEAAQAAAAATAATAATATATEPQQSSLAADGPSSKLFVNDSLVMENFIDTLMPLLEDFKTVAIDDIKQQLVSYNDVMELMKLSTELILSLGW